MKTGLKLAGLLVGLAAPTAASAQEDQHAGSVFSRSDREEEGSVFDDTWLAVGIGARFGTTYTGSDEYEVSPIPIIAGSVANIDFRPRAAGMAVDLFEIDLASDVRLDGGPVFRMRNERTGPVEDEIVEAAGELDRAWEVGGQLGLSFRRIFTRYDRITLGADIRWDVAGAHGGMVFDPGISYRTPVNRGIVASVSLGADYADDDFADYYFSVSPEQAAASGLPIFTADSGWYKAGGSAGLAFDLDGDIENGGLILGVFGGYSRLLDDAAVSPYTSIRGDRDQYDIAAGLGFVF